MNNIDKSNFGYLGKDFQLRLLQQIVIDRKFGESIIDILNPNYFGDSYFRDVAAIIIDAYDTSRVIPDMGSLKIRLLEKAKNDVEREFMIKIIHNIKEAEVNDGPHIKKMAMKFCKQQELSKAIREIQKITEKGDLDDYDRCEEILKKALEVGDNRDDGINVFDNIDDVLSSDFRDPIPTGIEVLDGYMGGGLSIGELGVILAAFGVGKTTMITKIANTAKNVGKNVVQIFFEDNPKVIQRKHYSCWTGIELNDLEERSEEVKTLVSEKQAEGGEIRLKKMPSDGTTIPKIKTYIRKLIASGFKPDIILVDYIDCIQPTKQFNDTWSGEGNVMRQFETMLDEFDLVGWTAVQGNRSSINSEIVESHQMGGSIKKGQIGHFIVSIAKTLEQKESGHGNMAILKSRFGKDGIILPNIIFDNAKVDIDATESDSGRTFLENGKLTEQRNQEHLKKLFNDSLDKKRETPIS